MDQLTTILRQNHMKVTPQRIAVYQVLASTNEHPSAEIIYKNLSSAHPTMSLATVYKSLEVFKKAGLVQELNVGEYSFRYDASVTSHPHMICTKCHRVEDLDGSLFSDLIPRIHQRTEYFVEHQQLYFYGTCPKCK